MEHLSSVQIRSGIFYFRQRLPSAVRALLNKREIVRSLRTADRAVALERRHIVMTTLRRAIALLIETDPKDIETARALFRKWFEGRLEIFSRPPARP